MLMYILYYKIKWRVNNFSCVPFLYAIYQPSGIFRIYNLVILDIEFTFIIL
jgi:hypothetical protein